VRRLVDYYEDYFVVDEIYIYLNREMMLCWLFVMNSRLCLLNDEFEIIVDMIDEILSKEYYK